MSFVSDLRVTPVFVCSGIVLVGSGLLLRADGGVGGGWLVLVSTGALQLVLVADGLQRRVRGDERARSADPDERGLAAGVVGFVALALVGLWSYVQGHEPLAWGLLLGGGLAGLVSLGWVRRGLRPE